MTQTEILSEFERLSILQQLEVIKAAVHIVEQHVRDQALQDEAKLSLGEAAQQLLQDYEQDKELTVFTSLDSEAIYVTK